MDHSWHQLSIATLGSGRARTRSVLAIPRVDERDHCAHVLGSFLALVCLERLPRAPTAILSAGTPDDIEACQQFGRRSGSAAADRPALFKNEPPRSRVVHFHRPVKAAYLKATVRAALEPVRK